ncbi:MAG: hypothetical protein QOE99_220, partial [Actinomycetota bacterium]|nr:hypothetical protein [Actinomycetota bacterium]
MTAPSRQPYPWRVEDLLRWYAVLALSLLGLAVAWWGISGTVSLSRSITWLDVAVLCLVASGLANTRWLLQGRRALAARRAAELPDVDELRRLLQRPQAVGLRVAVAGSSLHHQPDCQ